MEIEPTAAEIDLSTVKARSLTGIVTLVSRSFVLQLVSTGGFLALTYYLGRPEIGLFIAVNDLVSILGYFSDIGLAASLIQKKGEVTQSDLRTTFTLQQGLVVTSIIIMLVLSPWLTGYYHISGGGVWLLYSLLAAFFLASLKTIPSIILERQLKFQVLASVEVLENIVFYAVAVFFAWQGRGVASYAWAVLLRGLVGTYLIYHFAPWDIGIELSWASLKPLLSFGLPYQLNSTMAVIKDRFLNIALWGIIGADGVGVIGWAQTWSQKPLRFIMDNVTKVTFPSFARMQQHPEELKKGIEKTLFFITFITFPILGGIAVLTPKLIFLIPKYAKWQVALLPLTLYCFNSAWATVSTPLTNTLNALGKVKINTYLMIMWTVLAWVLTPALAIRYGFVGVAYATAIIAVSSLVPIVIVQRLTHFSWATIVNPTIATLIMLPVSYIAVNWLPNTIFYLLFTILISAVVYCSVILLLVGQSLLVDLSTFYHAFSHRS